MLALYQAIYLALASALGLDSGHWQTPILIRRAFVNPSPPPPPEDQNVVYYHLLPEDAPPLTEESCADGGHPAFFRYAPYLLHLVFYGPQAEETAWRVYHRLFLDGYGNPRRILRLSGIFPVPHPSAPQLIWEEWKERHRPRADLTVRLRAAVTEADDSASAGTVEHPPELTLHRQDEA